MGMTMIEKTLARAAGLGTVTAGQTIVCDVDMAVMIDLQFATDWIQPLRIADPDKVAVVMDHAVPAPTKPTSGAFRWGPGLDPCLVERSAVTSLIGRRRGR
jgi:homoaconitase/3-isopropylmalate dehydratase large subunit